MSVGALKTAARATLAHLLTDRATLYTAASDWATRMVITCQLEETPPQGGTGFGLNYETGAGYGATLFAPLSPALATGDRLVIGGVTWEVQRVLPVGSNEPLQRAVVVRR